MFGKRTNSESPAGSGGTAVAPPPPLPPAGSGDGAEQLWAPASRSRARKSVEALLLERQQVTEEQIAQARSVVAQTPGKSLAQILLQMNAATEAQILSALAETLGVRYESPVKAEMDPRAFELL